MELRIDQRPPEQDSDGRLKPRIGITWGNKVNGAPIEKLAMYLDALLPAGATPVALIPTELVPAAREALGFRPDVIVTSYTETHLEDLDGLILAGGADIDPVRYGQTPSTPTLKIEAERDAFELPLARLALEQGVPVLGICRGFQMLNVALGGVLVQDIPSQYAGSIEHRQGAQHEVEMLPGSHVQRLAGMNRIQTNSYHHQGVKISEGLAPGVIATAFAPDGVVEAFEPEPGRFPGYVLAVQWHPEKRDAAESPEFTAMSRLLFADFASACRSLAKPA